MKKAYSILAVLSAFALLSLAAPRSRQQMMDAARQAISRQLSSRHLAPGNAPMKVLHETEELSIIGHEDGNGFAVVSADDLFPAVMGVSNSSYSNGQNPNFQWWLEATRIAVKQAVARQQPMLVTVPDPLKYPPEVMPMVTTKWSQDAPYNNMCPVFSGTVRCLTGCVATAMAQILNYHRTPAHGIGERTIYYPQNNHSGQAVHVNFEEDYYDWTNMLDMYLPGAYDEVQANAVALLMRDCGVASNMAYGGPNEGSGTYSDLAADGLHRYFGFEDVEYLERGDYSEPAWMDIIYRELSENGPVYYGGASWVDGGHAFLFDGYNEMGQVSVNWGWAGDEDGYYYVSQLNPRTYNFHMQQDMITGIKSDKRSLYRKEEVTMTDAGQLQQILEERDTIENSFVGSLTVEGPVNDADLAYIRLLAGQIADGSAGLGRLHILDLTKAILQDNALPDSMFINCASLRRVRLPETTKSIGQRAFAGCVGLLELRVTSKSVPTLKGPDVFLGVPFGTSRLYVTNGLKTKYLQTAQWKDFGEENIFQVGTSVKVRNAIRYYGEKNPTFTYTVSGGKITGEPLITCDATQQSPAGRYAVRISAGSVENSEAVNFIDGYIIVRKAEGLRAQVQDCTRQQGEPNPEFTFTYSGLLSFDSEPVWLTPPTIYTNANEQSLPGTYVIYANSGEAESYEVTFLSGKLTVTAAPEPDAISNITTDTVDQPAFNLQGQRVNQTVRGLYIIGGKKVVRN